MTDMQNINNFRNLVVPIHGRRLERLNYEGMGVQDRIEYEESANRILDLAEQGLDLADWLADMVFDDNTSTTKSEANWWFFCELACRKLYEYGYVDKVENSWIRNLD